MLRRFTLILATALFLAQGAYAIYIRNAYDDLVVPFTLNTDNVMPPLWVDPLDPDTLGVELTVSSQAVFTRGGTELKIYLKALPEDIGDRTHVDLEWWNVNDTVTQIKWVEFTCYWAGVGDTHPWAHDFAGPQSYQQGAKFVTPCDNWMSITDIYGPAICQAAKFCKSVNSSRPFGRRGDTVRVHIMDPKASWPTLTRNLSYTPSNPLKYRLRNWRYYNPAHAGQRWSTHFDNPRGWDQVYVYAWAETSSGVKKYTGDWPGTPLPLDSITGKYEAAFKVVDSYGITGITFSNGQGNYLKFAADTHLDPANNGDYSQLLLAMRLEKPFYDQWEHVYVYSEDERFGVYPGTLMTAWPQDGSYPYPHHAPIMRTDGIDDTHYDMYYATLPSYVGDGIDVAFIGRDAQGNEVGRYPPEGSGQWLNMHDWQCYTLTSNPSHGSITSNPSLEGTDPESVLVEYYDMTGRRLHHPCAGQMVIRRQGSHITKTIAN